MRRKKTGDNRGAEALLDLVLTASGTRGTQGARGGVDGTVRKIEMVGSIVMGATEAPEMRETHLGRFAIIMMDKPQEGEDYRTEHAALIARMKLQGPSLWGRALASFERYQAALVVFRVALGDAGCAPREMDQLGAIMAGWWILVREGLPDEAGAAEALGALAGFVRTTSVVAEQSNARRLMDYLMTYAVQLDRSTARKTVATLIRAVLKGPPAFIHASSEDETNGTEVSYGIARTALSTNGMRVIRRDELVDSRDRPVPRLADGDGLWLNLGSTELARIFDNSDWQAGRWRSGLSELATARPAKFAVRVGDVSIKALWVGAGDLPIDDSG